MRIFAISDLHVDYDENKKWLENISLNDYKRDILILAGDITDIITDLVKTFDRLKKSFSEVIFVPGNHDLWVLRNKIDDSIKKFNIVMAIAENSGIKTTPYHLDNILIIPIYGWYDYSFGNPGTHILNAWRDFKACKWPDSFNEKKITEFFDLMNNYEVNIENKKIITFSHFVPRIDLMPSFIPQDKQYLYPVLGSNLIEKKLRSLNSRIHIYGHHHLNMRVQLDNVLYINNAFGYPSESHIARKDFELVYAV